MVFHLLGESLSTCVSLASESLESFVLLISGRQPCRKIIKRFVGLKPDLPAGFVESMVPLPAGSYMQGYLLLFLSLKFPCAPELFFWSLFEPTQILAELSPYGVREAVGASWFWGSWSASQYMAVLIQNKRKK